MFSIKVGFSVYSYIKWIFTQSKYSRLTELLHVKSITF